MINKNISYDGEIIISIGKSRKDTKYDVKSVKWSKFLQKVSSTYNYFVVMMRIKP